MTQDNSTQDVHGYDLHYFIPHEAIVTVEHNNVNAADIAEFVAEKLDQLEFPAGYSIDVERILNFSREEESEISAESQSESVANDLESPQVYYSHFALVPLVDVMKEQKSTELLSRLLEDHVTIQRNQQGFRDDQRGIQLSTLAPNWMQGASQGQVTTGGPGSRPTPPIVNGTNAATELRDKVKLTPIQQVLDDAKAGQTEEDHPVIVFILDTVPSVEQIQNATEHLAGEPDIHPTKALLKLLEPQSSPQMQIVRAADFSHVADAELNKVNNPMTFADDGPPVQVGNPPTDQAHIYDHSYVMRDHGLFIAGLVHELAPKAEIVLVEALNQYGLGTQLSLAAALNYVIEHLKARAAAGQPQARVIINISLTILAPADCGHVLPNATEKLIIENPALVKLVTNSFKTFSKLLAASVESFAWIERAAALYASGARMIAAAGNDGIGKHHPEPRFPALLASIVGVGALDADNDLADYSNICDRPEENGFNTFGGDDAIADKGLLSVYLGDFPPDKTASTAPANQHYMARWSGTSFACGVFSGLLAQLAAGASLDKGLSILKQQQDIPAGIGQVVRVKQGIN